MPIYEYECKKCGHEFEREQKMADPPVKTCPECKGRRVTKLISRSSFVLKGGGWYADGYADRKSDAKKDEKKDEKKDSKKEGDGAKGSDSASQDSGEKKSGEKKGQSKATKKGGGASKSAA